MQCYRISHDSQVGLKPLLAYKNNLTFEYPQTNKGKLFCDTKFDSDWRFTQTTRDALRRIILVTNPTVDHLPDFWGAIGPLVKRVATDGSVLASPKLLDLLTDLIPDQFDAVPAGKIFNRTFNKVLENHDHSFVSFLEKRDTYDRVKTKIRVVTRDDGSSYHMVGHPLVVDSKKIEDGIIWRERLDGELMCSERFRSAYENVGATGVSFNPVITSS